jgi:hypothetical protein
MKTLQLGEEPQLAQTGKLLRILGVAFGAAGQPGTNVRGLLIAILQNLYPFMLL